MERPSYVLEVFEGPLDLLMHLLQKNKVSIYDIPIAEISRQYIEYLEHMKEFNLEIASEFVVMAAQLLYIKSKMLLPKTELDQDGEDPRAELIEKLLEYSKYKVASAYLEEREMTGSYSFFRNPEVLSDAKVENTFDNVNAYDLFEVVRELLKNKKDEIIIPKQSFGGIVSREKVSIREKIKNLLNMLTQSKKCVFLDVFKDITSRPHIVAMFLGVLELLKMNRIDVFMDKNGELMIKLVKGGDNGGTERD